MKNFSLLICSLCTVCELSAQVTLEAYRDSVFVNSYEMAIADEQVSRSYSVMRKSYADFLPSRDGEASLGTSLRRMDDEKLWFFDISPRISQTLLGGGVRATYRQSQSQLRGAMYDAEYVRRTMLYEADYAYCPADSILAGQYETVCSCAEGAVADVIYKKIPAILNIHP